MFRNVYKEANDCIKGDREILDRAFLQAAQIEKRKSPIMRFSVAGTAVAAVLILGAVFMNSELFFEKDYKSVSMEAETEAVNNGYEKTRSTTFAGRVAAIEDYREEADGNIEVANVEADEVNEVLPLNEEVPEEKAEDNTPKTEKTEEIVPEVKKEEALEQNENVEAVVEVVKTDAPVVENSDIAIVSEEPEVEIADVDNNALVEEENMPEESMQLMMFSDMPEEAEVDDAVTKNKGGGGGASGGGSSSTWSMRDDTVAFEEEVADEEDSAALTEADIVRLAQEICTIEYVAVTPVFDEETQNWTVTFTAEDGSYQSVTLDTNGILQNLTSN